MDTATPFGHLLRDWRQRRRLTQLDLADAAGVSTRHVSFLETHRSLPSRALLMRLGAVLDMPLRERNRMLVSAGFAPMYREHRWDEQALQVAREAIERLLAAHEPYPALAIDRHWNLVTANAAAQRLMAGLPEALLAPVPNVLRASLHPDGLSSRIANLPQWRAHILERLQHQHEATQDPVLDDLRKELAAYPGGEAEDPGAAEAIIVPLQLRGPDGQVLSFLGTTTVFGTPNDVTLAELAIESFFPGDPGTAALLHAMAQA